jgi:flagellar hook assembly protein FlgD
VSRTSTVSIKVYSATGRLVATLVNGRVEPGRYAAYWDGSNSAGDQVSSGVYFYRMEAGDFSSVKKMLVVR